jgi:hypothetical protein
LIYRAELVPDAQQLKVNSFVVPEDDSSTTTTIAPTAQQVNSFERGVPALFALAASDVRRKNAKLSAHLKKPDASAAQEDFTELAGYGFVRTGFENENFVFDASEGEIIVLTADDVRMVLSIGTLADAIGLGSRKLNRYVMINCGVDLDRLREPQRPENLVNDDSQKNKEFLQSVEEFKKRLTAAKQIAASLNAIHADWYYLIPEEIIKRLRPDRDVPASADNPAMPPITEGTENE